MRTIYKKLSVVVVAASLSISSQTAFATGIPTVDAAALTQRLTEYAQLLKEYETIKNQLEQLEGIKSQIKNTISLKSFFDSLLAQLQSLPSPQSELDGIWSKVQSQSGRSEIEAIDNSSTYNNLRLLRQCKVNENYEEIRNICYEKVGLYYKYREKTDEDFARLDTATHKVYELVNTAKNSKNVADINEAVYAINTSETMIQVIKQRIESRNYTYKVNLDANEKRQAAAMAAMTAAPSEADIKDALDMGW